MTGACGKKKVSQAGFHWVVVVVLLCISEPFLGQSTAQVAEHSRALERSGQLLFERGVLLYGRAAATDKREALSFFLRAAEDFKAGGAVGKQATAMLLAGCFCFRERSISPAR